MHSRPQSYYCEEEEPDSVRCASCGQEAWCTTESEEMLARCKTAPTVGEEAVANIVAVWEVEDTAAALCFCAADQERLTGWFQPGSCSHQSNPGGVHSGDTANLSLNVNRRPPRIPRRPDHDSTDLYEFRHHSDIRRYIEDYRDRGNNKKRRNEQLVSCLHKAMIKAKQAQEQSEAPSTNNKYRTFHPSKDSDHGDYSDHGDHNHRPEADFLLAPEVHGSVEDNTCINLPKLTSRKAGVTTRHSMQPTRCGFPHFQEVEPLPILTNGMPYPFKVVQEYTGAGKKILRYDLSDVVRTRKIPTGRFVPHPFSWSSWDLGSSPSFSPSSGSSGGGTTDLDGNSVNFPRLRYTKGPEVTRETFGIDGRGNVIWHADRRDPAKSLVMQRMFRRKPNFGALTSNKGKFTGDSVQKKGTGFSTGINGRPYRTTEQHQKYFQQIARSLHERKQHTARQNIAFNSVKNDT
ncbi:Hypp1391 [Branchiostoma lanceolatum]|uniref:Hypp1391 protein n=1 Tax=Branchiostoma lanceolatum TaxID=7740 RepID=A0A8K0EIM8_BRALA|nr:Hypp1391 [Branchiostoma lanceolatum]